MPSIRVVTYNTQFCRGLDGVVNPDRIAAAVRSADLIALQEIDVNWSRSGSINQAKALSKALPEHRAIFGPGFSVLATAHQGNETEARWRQFGNMLLVRGEILASRNHLLPRRPLRDVFTLQKSALEAIVQINGIVIQAFSLHLSHLSADIRLAELACVLEAEQAAYSGGGAWSGRCAEWSNGDGSIPRPLGTLLLGDFNMNPESPEYHKLVGLNSTRYGRLSAADSWEDVWLEAGNAADPGFTGLDHYSATDAPARIDYCFRNRGLSGGKVTAWIDREAAGSDHPPLWVQMEI